MVKSVLPKDGLERGVWFKIAKRKAIGDGVWHPLENAVMTIDEAKMKYDAGIVEMCQSRDEKFFYQQVLVREKVVAGGRDFFFVRPTNFGFHNRLGSFA